MEKIELRPYQRECVNKILWAKNSNLAGNDLVCMAQGSGKSIVIAHLAHQLDEPILILQPSKEILEQNLEKLSYYVDRAKIGIYSASMKEKVVKYFTFATIGSIYKKPEEFKHFGLVLIDECFVAGTKVENKNIENIKIGDYVNSFNHQKNCIEKKKVLSISKRWYEGILTNIDNGLIISTYNHPYYVKGKGYIPAKELKQGDAIYAIQESTFTKTEIISMQQMRKDVFDSIKTYFKKIQKKSTIILQKMQIRDFSKRKFNKNEEKKSYVDGWSERKNDSNSQKNRTQASNTRGQWEKNANTARNVIQRIRRWLVSKINNNNWQWLSASSLQNRYWKPNQNDSRRSKWSLSLFFNSTKTRQKKRHFFKIKKLESIQSYEQGSYGKSKKGCWVYNLEIEDNNNYFANGVLVHNCHLVNIKNLTGMFSTFLKNIGNVKCIGFTATPYRMGLGYRYEDGELIAYSTIKLINRMKGFFWKRLLFNITTQELIDKGFLCPLEYIDRSLIDHADIPRNKSESEFDLEKYEKMLSNRQVEIIKAIEYAKSISKSVLVFCSSVKQAEKLAGLLNGSVVSAKTKTDERDDIVERFRNGEIKIIFNVGIFVLGFNYPALDCIVLLRPTRSIGLYTQAIGRGLRIAEGKKNCKVIDLTSTIKNLGRVETIRVEKQDKWEIISETGSWHNKELYNFTIKKKPKKNEEPKKEFDICPLCKVGVVREKEGKFGTFLGCSKFPNCRFTSSIKEVNKNRLF